MCISEYLLLTLTQLEQEIEHIREGQRMLEASTSRREKLEGALRAKLEKQVRSLRGEIVHLKGTYVHATMYVFRVATYLYCGQRGGVHVCGCRCQYRRMLAGCKHSGALIWSTAYVR